MVQSDHVTWTLASDWSNVSEQLMCPLGYQEGEAGLAVGLLILAGLIGSFILGPLARRYNTQVATTKVAMPLAAIFGISLAECLRFPNFYPGILISLMGFGFCGLGSFPIILELSVEVRSPDAQFYHKTLPRKHFPPTLSSPRP